MDLGQQRLERDPLIEELMHTRELGVTGQR
jgi:hypothetical protein